MYDKLFLKNNLESVSQPVVSILQRKEDFNSYLHSAPFRLNHMK